MDTPQVISRPLYSNAQSVSLFDGLTRPSIAPFKRGLLKWIGSKQKMAHEIVSFFPPEFGTYYEPFLGSGAVLGTLRPSKAVASDVFAPLMEIWQCLRQNPGQLKQWYFDRYVQIMNGNKVEEYENIKKNYNANPNGADFLSLCRTCYAGVVRFRKSDGYMSTPCGPHNPMPPNRFAERVDDWHKRTSGANFYKMDYREAMLQAKKGDLIYCDPPYSHSQSILYGAQEFKLEELLDIIAECKSKGVKVALSIDGTKRSGNHICDLPIPDGLFAEEAFINCGRSMLKRLQMEGQTLEEEVVSDRLLLTY